MELRELGDRVGRERVQVVHGDLDRMITVPHAEVLIRELGGEGEGEVGVKRVIFEGRGHVLPMEEREEFGRLVKGIVERTERLNRQS